MTRAIAVILNARSGARRPEVSRAVIEKVLTESGRPFQISVASGSELSRIVREKGESDAEVLVGAGGDGTICQVAEVAQKSGKTLGVLPLGTFNYFARNLGISLDLEAAVRVLLDGHLVRAPVLDLDGRLVLNNSSFGILPKVLLKRRTFNHLWGRFQFNTHISAFLTAFQPAPKVRVRLITDEGEVVRETPLVMLCTNAFQMGEFGLAGGECLENGKFALYIARLGGRRTIFGLAMRTLLRRLRHGIDYELICCSDVTIENLRRKKIWAAADGEVKRLETPMRFRIKQEPLCVLAPRAPEKS